jgi:hypothetical protein
MDDIVTCSREWPDVLTKLETILKTLDSNNLSCQPGKCSFAFPSITFLGVEVSRHGLKITDVKIKILRSLKPPKDKKSLQKTFDNIVHYLPNQPTICAGYLKLEHLLSGRVSVMLNSIT